MTVRRRAMSRIYRWSSRSKFALAFGVLAIILDIAGVIGSSSAGLILGILSVAYGLLQLGRDVAATKADLRELGERLRIAKFMAPYAGAYEQWDRFEFNGLEAIHDETLDERFRAGCAIGITRVPQTWIPIDDWLEKLRRLKRLSLDTDGQKIRLSSDILSDTDTAVLQKTFYSAFLVTNKLGLVDLTTSGDRDILTGEKALLLDGRIPTFNRSSASNHLGVDVLGLVDDGRVLLTRQSAHNQLSENLLAPSGSGSVDWRDLTGSVTLHDVLTKAMRREMHEELGLKGSKAIAPSAIRVLGYARLTHLGGKPQFFGVARLSQASPVIRSAERRYVSDHLTFKYNPDEGAHGLRLAIRQYIAMKGSDLSFPLYINLQYLDRWLESDQGAAKWLGLAAALH